MRQRLPLAFSAAALVIAVLGATPFGQAAVRAVAKAVPVAKVALFADNAGKLNGHKSSSSPGPGQIPLVGTSGKLPASIVPSGGSSGGGAGPAGPAGPTGATGATGPAGPSAAYSAFANGPITLASGSSYVQVKALSIPAAGNYLVFTKVYLVDGNSTNGAQVECQLSAQGDSDLAGSSMTPRSQATISLNVVHQFAGAGNAVLSCNGGPYGEATWIKITAVQVGSLSNNGV
jgi:hypothetical protein